MTSEIFTRVIRVSYSSGAARQRIISVTKSVTVTTNSSFFNAFSLSNFNRSIELFRNFPLEKFFEEKDAIVTKYFA